MVTLKAQILNIILLTQCVFMHKVFKNGISRGTPVFVKLTSMSERCKNFILLQVLFNLIFIHRDIRNTCMDTALRRPHKQVQDYKLLKTGQSPGP